MRLYPEAYAPIRSEYDPPIRPRFRDERDPATKGAEGRKARAAASRERSKARAAKYFQQRGEA